MRTPSISHRKDQPIVLLQSDQIQICEGNHCAAALLANFEYWDSVRSAQIRQERVVASVDREYRPNLSPWVYKQISDLGEDILGLYGESAISKGVAYLIEKGFVECKNNEANPFDRTKMYRLNIGVVQAAIDGATDGGNEEKPPARNRETTACKPQNRPLSLEETTDKETTGKDINTPEPILEETNYQTALEILGKLRTEHRKALLAACPLPVGPSEVKEWCKANGIFAEERQKFTRPAQREFSRPTYRPTVTQPASAPTNYVALPSCQTIDEFLAQCNNPWFSELIYLYVTNGMDHKITLPVVERFWPVFARHKDYEQEGTVYHARKSFPKSLGFTKMPENYMADKPWTAPRYEAPPALVKAKSNGKGAAEMLEYWYTQHPEERPGRTA